MPTARTSIIVNASADLLFALSQDYDRRLAWDPFLKEARLLGGATQAGIGVKAWCVARSGLGMETEYITFAPPRMIAVRMTRGPALLAAFSGSWRFEAFAPGRTRVTFAYHLRSRPRWLRWLVDPILQLVFARGTWRRLRALRRAAETSSSTNPTSRHDPSHRLPPG